MAATRSNANRYDSIVSQCWDKVNKCWRPTLEACHAAHEAAGGKLAISSFNQKLSDIRSGKAEITVVRADGSKSKQKVCMRGADGKPLLDSEGNYRFFAIPYYGGGKGAKGYSVSEDVFAGLSEIGGVETEDLAEVE